MKKLYTLALMCLLGAACAVAQTYQSAVPAPGETVSSLSEVLLTFGGTADFGSNYKNVTVTGVDVNYTASCTLDYGTLDTQIKVSFSEITDNGTYTVNFPADAVTVDGTAVPAFTLQYTVGEDLGEATLIPAPGEVKWLYEVVYYNPAIETTISTQYGLNPTATTPSGETVELTAVYDWQIGNGKYRFNFPRLMTETGVYTINFPEEYLYYNNENYERVYLPASSFEFEVVGGELTQIVGTPSVENPTTMFNQFSIAFPGYTTVAKNSTASITIWREGAQYAVTSFSMDYNITVEGNTINYYSQWSSYTDPGHYYMTFPEGCVLLGEEQTPCTPFVYEFDVVEPAAVDIVFTPADGANVSMLYKTTVNFPTLEQVELSSNPSAQLMMVKEDGTDLNIGSAYGTNSFRKVNDNTYDIVFSNMATETGKYKIVLQKNAFTFEGGFNQEAEVTVNFTAPVAVAPSIDPADGSELDKIQNFTISFPEAAVVTLNPYTSKTNVTLYTGTELEDNGWGGYTNSQVGSSSAFIPVEGSTNSFTFSLSSAAIDKGDYLLVIPKGLFLIGEDYATFSDDAIFHYSATGNGLDKIEVTPSTPVKALQDMEITFVNESAIYLQSEWTGFTFYKYVEGQSWGTYLEYPSASNGGATIEGNTLKIHLNEEYTEDGVYYIEISAYSLFMSDHTTASTPQKVYFTVDSTTGIENMSIDKSADSRIFTIQGIEVNDMSAPGLYIVGGKKVLVK